MERLSEEGQWIVLMGFIISVGIFFLAIIINQSVMVGQTTAEGVLEFPKAEIQDIRSEIIQIADSDDSANVKLRKQNSLEKLSIERINSIVGSSISQNKFDDSFYNYTEVIIHFNNGVTSYDETYLLAEKN